jgi:hypothetical protein
MIRRTLSLLAVTSLLAISPAFGQTDGNPPAQRRQAPAPTNLKVLPKDITGQQLIAIMRGFTGDLGVGCNYCHAEDPATHRPNFASDANPMKDRARVMIKMAQAINTEYLTQLDNPKAMSKVTCGTCHRGMSTPAEFVPQPRQRPAPATQPTPTTPQQSM